MKVLLVEDEALIAMWIEDMLTDAGHIVIGSAGTVAGAQRLVEDCAEIDFALLDVNLRGETVYPIARLLQERGVPFLFTSGYGATGIESGFAHVPVVSKPVDERILLAAITKAAK